MRIKQKSLQLLLNLIILVGICTSSWAQALQVTGTVTDTQGMPIPGVNITEKSTKKGEPLWDPSKLKVGDWFSCISYLKVEQIDGTKIRVKNHRGGEWFIS